MASTRETSDQNNDYKPTEPHSLKEQAGTFSKSIGKRAKNIANSITCATIHRVPEALRRLNERAYTPRLVSIGPLHCNDKHLISPGQDIKMSYVDSLLRRVESKSGKPRSQVLEECLGEMDKLLNRATECYAEELVDDRVLTKEMLVIDGCFILELIFKYSSFGSCKSCNSNHDTNGDAVFSRPLVRNFIQHDLLLLENQLPWFVLDKLFKLTWASIEPHTNLLLRDYVLKYFEHMLSALGYKRDVRSTSNAGKCCCRGRPSDGCVISIFGDTKSSDHILHLLHNQYHPSDKPEDHSVFNHSASDLNHAGVKFVPGTGEEDLLTVKFIEPEGPFKWCSGARFEIPTLQISNATEPFFRNLIAFEQCCPGVSRHITWYAFLMDKLINTGDDVKLLQKAKVVTNLLGTYEKASDLFNELCREVVVGEFYFAKDCKRAAEHNACFWPKQIADLKRKYFLSPWTCVAFVVAFLVFGMTTANFIRNLLR